MATLVARQVRGMKEPVYYYHRTYRVKVAPGDSGKGPGSGASRVKTEEVYLGTAEQVRARCRELPKLRAGTTLGSGGQFPGAEHPVAPSGVGNEEGAAAVFSGGSHVQGIPPILGQGGVDALGLGLVQRLQVRREPDGEGADLAAGDLDAVLAPQLCTDLLALPVVDEARQPDGDLDVIAEEAPRWHQAAQLVGAPGQAGARGPGAAGGTHPHRLAGPDATVGQGDHAVVQGLLDQHPATAAGTGDGGGRDARAHLGHGAQALLAGGLQLPHVFAQRG